MSGIVRLLLLMCLLFPVGLMAEDDAKGGKEDKEKDPYAAFNKGIMELGKKIVELQKKKEEVFKKDQERLLKKKEKLDKQLPKVQGNKKKQERLESEMEDVKKQLDFLQRCADMPDLKLEGDKRSQEEKAPKAN